MRPGEISGKNPLSGFGREGVFRASGRMGRRLISEDDQRMSDVVVYDANQSRMDALIMRGLGVKSIRQIADEVGMPVDAVLKRKGELREEIDVLSIHEKRMQMMVSLDEMARKLQDDYDASPWEFKSGIMNSANSAFKTVLAELARIEARNTGEVEALNRKRVAELVALVQEVVLTTVDDIADEFSLDADVLYSRFDANMQAAAARREAL